jgi:polyhydroxyalkanoate synthesis regulator phasin
VIRRSRKVFMPFNVKGECRNTGRTHFKKGQTSWNKGRSPSEETLKKMKIANKETCKKYPRPMQGKHHTEETRQRIRETLLKRHEGELKHSGIQYQNNIWRELRKIVYRRDG